MYESELGVALLLSLIVLIGLAIKYYQVVKAAEAKLPASATTQQKIVTAFEALIAYAKANPVTDKQALQALVTLVTVVGALAGVNVTVFVDELNTLVSAIPKSG
jgi:UDP-N-acetylmuramyl pentapeptide phosphotransferase/UDP-N-acetylglucosamine-1-phosphate transferase